MTKRLIVILILTALTASCAPCYAEEVNCAWARITKDNVCLYAEESCEKAVMLLEKSYYVEIAETLDGVYLVTVMPNSAAFPAICGYVRKIEVEQCQVSPLTPIYPTEKITVTADSAQLKLLPLTSSENVVVATNSQTLNYYGKLTYYGKSWYYVCFGGKFGYVDVSATTQPLVSPHPTPLETYKPTTTTPTPPDETEQTNNKTPAAEILLIVFVILLAAGLTLALFLPGNVKKGNVFDQDI